jgi:aspartate/tyrosine/aromatic aminotransferase
MKTAEGRQNTMSASRNPAGSPITASSYVDLISLLIEMALVAAASIAYHGLGGLILARD